MSSRKTITVRVGKPRRFVFGAFTRALDNLACEKPKIHDKINLINKWGA